MLAFSTTSWLGWKRRSSLRTRLVVSQSRFGAFGVVVVIRPLPVWYFGCWSGTRLTAQAVVHCVADDSILAPESRLTRGSGVRNRHDRDQDGVLTGIPR